MIFFIRQGESFSGKFIPAIADLIVKKQDEAKQYFNFQGIGIGDGFTDPVNQLNMADLLYQLSYIDDAQRDNMTAGQNLAIQQINEGKKKTQ